MEEKMKTSNEDRGDEYEHCVRCGRQLFTKRSTHIDLRPDYVSGAGELCHECYKLIYRETDDFLDRRMARNIKRTQADAAAKER